MNDIDSKNDNGGPWINIYKHPTEKIYWSGSIGYSTKELAQYNLCDETHRIATINIEDTLNMQKEIRKLREALNRLRETFDTLEEYYPSTNLYCIHNRFFIDKTLNGESNEEI